MVKYTVMISLGCLPECTLAHVFLGSQELTNPILYNNSENCFFIFFNICKEIEKSVKLIMYAKYFDECFYIFKYTVNTIIKNK